MKGIIGCESSGRVRDAMIAAGHDVVSCDLLPSEVPGPHIQGDLLEVLASGQYDFMIAHPPCTYLCSSGLHWNKRRDGRAEQTEEALRFVIALMNAPIMFKGIENPIGCISTRIALGPGGYYILPAPVKDSLPPSQIIQPFEYGHPETKSTALWLQGLPLLKPTGIAPVTFYCRKCKQNYTATGGNYTCCNAVGKIKWDNVTPSGQNRLSPSADRWKERSKTYNGIAEAMAQQWGAFLHNPPISNTLF